MAASVSFAQAFVGAAEASRSEPLLQVQPRVHRRDLFAVAVVHARGDAVGEQLAGLAGDAAFGLLAPARMVDVRVDVAEERSEEHTSELQSLMRISYAVFCLKKKKARERQYTTRHSKERTRQEMQAT